MKRLFSQHAQQETEHLDHAIERLEADPDLIARAGAELSAASAQEPLIAQSLKTPQDPRCHAEGPFMDAHLRVMLVVLYAVVEEKLHLIDIEELRRLRHCHGEIDELEETFKEHVSTFETFILTHDLGKSRAIVFESAVQSKGEQLGFTLSTSTDPQERYARSRDLRERYVDIFDRFASLSSGVGEQEIQRDFYRLHKIGISYYGHDRLLFTPALKQVFERVARAHELSDVEERKILEIAGIHLGFQAFDQVNPRLVAQLLHRARARGFDGDDFMDLVQGCIFLDWVCGSLHAQGNVLSHNSAFIENALVSEYIDRPAEREQKEHQREQQKNVRRNRAFALAGLDGVALMDVLSMDSGPAFGKILRQIQSAVLGEGAMPTFTPNIERVIAQRTSAFYEAYFDKGL